MLKRSVNSKYRNDGIRVRRVLQYVLFADVADKLCARTSRFHSVLFVIISARRNLLFPPPFWNRPDQPWSAQRARDSWELIVAIVSRVMPANTNVQ